MRQNFDLNPFYRSSGKRKISYHQVVNRFKSSAALTRDSAFEKIVLQLLTLSREFRPYRIQNYT